MSEKRKWFDPAAKHADAAPVLVSSSAVSALQAQEVLNAARRLYERQRIPRSTFNLLVQLCTMPPARRLAKNLSTVLRLSGEQQITDVMREGLTRPEQMTLLDLEHVGAPPEFRAAVQGLLNVSERMQMIDATRTMFREERGRRWEVVDG